MSLQERLDRLDSRERQLLVILVAVFLVLVLVLLPVGITALLASRRGDNEQLREAVNQIQSGREAVQKRNVEREAVVERYSRAAPQLAGFLDKLAKDSGIEIPESQDRAPVPHGKKFEERSTKIVLRKVGMLNLVKFMERIEQSGHPVSISRLNIRKRGTELDSYDVEMVVSAFDRKGDTKEPKQPAPGEEESEL
jgi:general secretion pathway protein M